MRLTAVIRRRLGTDKRPRVDAAALAQEAGVIIMAMYRGKHNDPVEFPVDIIDTTNKVRGTFTPRRHRTVRVRDFWRGTVILSDAQTDIDPGVKTALRRLGIDYTPAPEA
jgi:hypothetical protein